jgi:polar amino acid transport system permease protein
MHTLGLPEALLLLKGLRWTVVLTLIGFAGGCAGGMLVALARTSASAVLRAASGAFVEVFRGTPLLLQLFVVYYGVALLGFSVSEMGAVSLCLTLNASAFLGDIWRGAIQAVPTGQAEAAKALGLSYWHRSAHVVLPQAFKISLPAAVGFLVQLLKGTSLASIIGFAELMRTSTIISNALFNPFLAYGIASLVYFAVCWPLSAFARRAELRLSGKG